MFKWNEFVRTLVLRFILFDFCKKQGFIKT